MLVNGIKRILLLIFILIIGFGLGLYFERSLSQTSSLSKLERLEHELDVLVENEKEKVDSFNMIIIDLIRINDSLKQDVEIIERERIVEVNNVKNLPIDSAVIYLKQKLRKYEKND